MDFKGKTVIITGSGRGIGKSIAKQFAEARANVVLNSVSDSAEKYSEELNSKGYNTIAVRGDVGNEEFAKRLIETAVEKFGTIDILVNNAGITRDTLLIKMSENDWDSVMYTNLKSAFLCSRAAARHMMKKRCGRIINITSVVGQMGNAGQVNYSSSKAGMIGLTKSIAKELAPRGITCNAVSHGAIASEMTDVLSEEIKDN